MKILAAIIVFGILVAVHEFGHFIIAKLNNTRIREFAIGMGAPILFKKKIGETIYSLRALPIGGFCDFAEDEIEENGGDERSFNNKSPWVRMAIVLAGPIFNFILAFIIFMIVVATAGYTDTKISNVIPNGPAATVGIQPGDKIIAVDNRRIHLFDEFVLELYKVRHDTKRAGKEITVTVERDNNLKDFVVKPVYDKKRDGYIIGVNVPALKKANPVQVVQYGYYKMAYNIDMMVYGLKQLVLGNVNKNEVSGPVGIVKMVGESAEQGILTLAVFGAMLSINLGVINLVPLPALDGSRFLIAFVEAITKRRVNRKMEAYFHTIGFIGLMILMLFITYNDIMKIFT